jgi:hypothetical protein
MVERGNMRVIHVASSWSILATLGALAAGCAPAAQEGISPPAPVAGLQAEVVAAGNALRLAWSLAPDAGDAAGVLIVRKAGVAPAGILDGALVCDSDPGSVGPRCDDDDAHLDHGLTDGVVYHYAAFAHDPEPNYAAPARAAATPADSVAPEPLRSIEAQVLAPGTQALLSLELPLDTTDLAGIRILKREGEQPQGPWDDRAETVYDGPVTNAWLDAAVVSGRETFYQAYGRDEVPNFSAGLGARLCACAWPVTGLAVVDPGLGNRLDLSWTNPLDGNPASVRIFRFAGECDPDPDPVRFDLRLDLALRGPGQEQGWSDEPVADGLQVCYAVWVRSQAGVSAGAFASGISTDRTPPQALTGLTVVPSASAGDRAMDLSWTNPPDPDLARVVILRRIGGPPQDPQDAEAVVVFDGLGEACRDEPVADGVDHWYRGWAFDEVPISSAPADATASRSFADDDGDGVREDQGDCDDVNALAYPGATSLDCSSTDWDCDGAGWDDAFCEASAPDWLDVQCTSGPAPHPCLPETGCEFYELQDHTPCSLVTDPDLGYDICVAGGCRSPGSCQTADCNSPGPAFVLPPSIGHTALTRSGAAEPVVIDQITGLTWQGCGAGLSGVDCEQGSLQILDWSSAVAYCDGLDWAGFQDWHLPDRYELMSITDHGRILPAIDPVAFPATSAYYWTSSTFAVGDTIAWLVFFDSGNMSYFLKSYGHYVRCVRAGV